MSHKGDKNRLRGDELRKYGESKLWDKPEKCGMCNGEGLIGGLTPHNGYESEDCPDCLKREVKK